MSALVERWIPWVIALIALISLATGIGIESGLVHGLIAGGVGGLIYAILLGVWVD